MNTGAYFMRAWLLMTLVAFLAACSAGGSGTSNGGGGGGGGGGSPTIALSLSSSTVSSSAPATVSATVHDADGAAVAGTVVSFEVNSAIGTLSAPAALTDASGIASVTLSPSTSVTTGADTVTATATVNGSTVTASKGYQLSATSAQFTSLVSDVGTSASDKLGAYSQAVLTATMTGVSAAAPVSLSLTSACVAAGKATISPQTITTGNSTIAFTYKDTGGCGATQPVDTVVANVVGSSTSTSAQLYLTSPTANSITFVDPGVQQVIYLKGSGYTESAAVRFQVVDTAGNPLPGQVVSLTLSTFTGGLKLDQKDQSQLPETQTSDSSGFVTAIVNSGTVPTSVRVVATLGNGISANSNNLGVSTGLPSQLNFSLSQGTINIEGMDHDGTANTYSVIAGDRSGNPVPNLTTISFWAEAGNIQSPITTSVVNGTSTATSHYVTSEPRPADGRVTVVAYALGEESFVDLNGNNMWDPGEPFQDLGDVVKDKLYDNIFDSTFDEFVSLSLAGAGSGTQACVDSSATYPLFKLDAYTPNRPSTCDGTWSGKTYVRRAVETVYSSSTPNPYWPSNLKLDNTCVATPIYITPPTQGSQVALFSIVDNPNIYVGTASSGAFSIVVADSNLSRLNPMPAGTKVEIASNDTSTMTVAVTGGGTVANTSEATGASFSYSFVGAATGGSGTISFTTPLLLKTTVAFSLTRSTRPSTCP
jgi:hypothetical protein